jgi:hypothetical protein
MGRDWGGTGEGLRKGRSVHEQPGAKVDGIAPHKERDSRGTKGEPARRVKDGFAPYLHCQSVYVYAIIV